MRRLPAALLAGAAAMLLATSAAAAPTEPVSVTAIAPEAVAPGATFTFEVAVEAEAAALDIAAAPLTLGVKLAPECGGSFVGTPGSAVLERVLPDPVAKAAYTQRVTAQATAPASGTEVICAFLQDSQERQFATDTEAEVSAGAPPGGSSGGSGGGGTGVAPSGPGARCAAATAALAKAKLNLKHLNRRIRRVRARLRRADADRRDGLASRLDRLRARRRSALARRRAAAKTVTTACG